jgi:catechol 2,3-dioxygenase-like lactoylglutathione lyase family enzyme
MDLTIARCFVTVTDPDKALAFYRDVLGLELVMDVPNGDFRWITVGSKSQPGVQIVLSNYIQGSPEDLSYVAGLVAKGALNAVHFRTDDLDGLFVKLAEAGAEIVSEPTSQPWGARDGAVRDPSGNLIRIDQA